MHIEKTKRKKCEKLHLKSIFRVSYLSDSTLVNNTPFILKVGVHTIWCIFGQFKFVQKDHLQRNTNQSYISI